MRLIEMKCPNCGASVHADADTKRGVCEYCKSEFVLDSAEQNGYDFEKGRIRAQAEAQRLEDERRLEQWQQEMDEQQARIEEAKNRKGMSREAVFGIILGIAGIILAAAVKPGITVTLIVAGITILEAILIAILIRKRKMLTGRKDDVVSIVGMLIMTIAMIIVWL